MRKKDQVVLVNDKDDQVGVLDKTKTHQGKGLLHRAVSVQLIRRRQGGIELLIQKRSRDKLLWPGYWTNTICTHPRKDEDVKNCAVRRLYEELRIKTNPNRIRKIYTFIYQAKYNSLYSEHEYDHVFIGDWDGEVDLNEKEIDEIKWVSYKKIINNMKDAPNAYTPWFQKIINNPIFRSELEKT